jgi:hypothetical protein
MLVFESAFLFVGFQIEEDPVSKYYSSDEKAHGLTYAHSARVFSFCEEHSMDESLF